MTDSVELGVVGILVYIETMSFNDTCDVYAVYMMNRIGPSTEPRGTPPNSMTDDIELLP